MIDRENDREIDRLTEGDGETQREREMVSNSIPTYVNHGYLRHWSSIK